MMSLARVSGTVRAGLLIILAIVLLLVLPEPWDLIGLAAGLVLGGCEIFFWWRTVRGHKVQTGAEAMIGATARVTAACRPDGEVWLEGARWRAHCADGADVDDLVTVTDRDELLLIVSRSAQAEQSAKEAVSGDRLDR
jgi:membrane protein implicated in regulation of membrane protease activity